MMLTVKPLISPCQFWSRDSAFYCPRQSGAAQALPQHFLGYSGVPRQIGQRIPIAFVVKQDVRNAVVALFAPRSPSAVTGLVTVAVVHSLQRVETFSRRTFSHVGEEIIKGVEPASADCYAAFPVMFERRIGRLSAARDHVRPRLKRRTPSIPSSVTMTANTARHMFSH